MKHSAAFGTIDDEHVADEIREEIEQRIFHWARTPSKPVGRLAIDLAAGSTVPGEILHSESLVAEILNSTHLRFSLGPSPVQYGSSASTLRKPDSR